MTVEIIEKANLSNVINNCDITKARGSATFDAGTRIQEGYAKAGKSFGAYLAKKLK